MGWFSGKKKTDASATGASASGASASGAPTPAGGKGGKGEPPKTDTGAATPGGGGKGESPKSSTGAAGSEARDPRKARRFFEVAETVAASRNYDYAIELYINGLRNDPENMKEHENLRDVAVRRRTVGGGKPAGFMDKGPTLGKGPSDRMLAAEYLWAKNPLDPQLALNTMELAHKAELEEVTYWIGQFVVEHNSQQKSPRKSLYAKVVDIYEDLHAWAKAVEVQKIVLRMSPDDMNALQKLKNLEAENTMQLSNYDGKEGGFVKGVRDAEKQKALSQQDSIAASAGQLAESIARLRKEAVDNPDDVDRMLKFVNELLKLESDETENEAIVVLTEGFEKYKQYRMKMKVGDIKRKQFNRRVRQIRLEAQSNPAKQGELTEQLKKVRDEQLKFELAEFTERVENYPTDMAMRFELGVRQFLTGEYDLAIGSFQESQADPKQRANSLRYLGEAFTRKHWYDEAIDTFTRGIEVHPYNDDKLALELRYELVRAFEAKARRDKSLSVAEEAAKIASQIAQTDFNYKDIRQIIDRLRALIGELRAAG